MSDFKEMSLLEALTALQETVGDLFYSSLEHQFDDNYPLAHRHAKAFHALVAVYRHHGIPLPEPFGVTPLRTLAKEFLKELEDEAETVQAMLDAGMEIGDDDEDDDDEPEPWQKPAETPDEGPWLV